MKRKASTRKNKNERLLQACIDNELDVVRDALKSGADANAKDRYGYLGTHLATEKGNVDIVNVLIDNGADVNAVTKGKWTALHFAAEEGHVDVAKVLLRNGADVNAVTKKKATPLRFAALCGHVDVAKMLIQNGADVNAVEQENNTALHYAAMMGHPQIAKILLQNDVDVNAVNREGNTSFYVAVEHGYICFALQLLCFGAEIDELAIEHDSSGLIRMIETRLKLLRNGNRMGTTLMSSEERRFMWNLAFFFTIKHGGAIAFKAYYTVRSFITFHGIFMAHGYDIGNGSAWRQYDDGDNERYDDS